MTLATRLSAFFLAALAAVLVGFSTALFVSAWGYLNSQVDERLDAALAVLAAAVEISPAGVEWEPQERELPLGHDRGPDRLRWMVHEAGGARIDHSRNLNDANLTPEWSPRSGATLPPLLVDRQGRWWRIAQRRIAPGARDPASGSDAAAATPAPRDSDRRGLLHPSLMLTVAVPTAPIDRTLATLGWLVVGLSVGIWGLAAGLGRRFVRRAIAPLTRTAASARGLDAADAGWSLPPAGTGDELDVLVDAFNDLLGRLRVAYERQGRFAADASHQLRTPLTALIGQIEVALRRDRSEAEYRRVLGLVRGQAGGLARIVEALLFLGRADADAGLPESTPTDLAAWAVAHLDAHPGVAIDLDGVSPDGAWARVHPPLMGQLVDNLLDNSAKYGRPDGAIVVRVASDAEAVTLSVEDEGRGIAPADLGRIFEPFFRSATTRRLGRPGVGLGLAVVHRIATAFGATIRAESEPGVGSRFVLRCPRCASPASAPPRGLAVATARRGVTIVEVLAIVAVIGVLVALLLPAIAAGREAARQTRCRNNLKQIGLGLHAYHDGVGSLPMGYVRSGPHSASTSPGWGWSALVLARMEASTLANSCNFSIPIEWAENLTSRTASVATYICPSDWNTGLFTAIREDGSPICPASSMSYAGNFGREVRLRGVSVDIADAPTHGNGLFLCNRVIRLGDVTDGLSGTIAVGERGSLLTRVPWAGAIDRAVCTISPDSPSQSDGVSLAAVQPLAHLDDIGINDPNADPDNFFSAHPGGAQFLMADGSVRFIRKSVSISVLRALASRDYGEAISQDSY